MALITLCRKICITCNESFPIEQLRFTFWFIMMFSTCFFNLKRLVNACEFNLHLVHIHKESCRSSRPEVFLRKGVLKICHKFTGKHPCKATFLKSHFDMGVFLYICCIFSEHLFLRTPLDGCFLKFPTACLTTVTICSFLTHSYKQERVKNTLSLNFRSNTSVSKSAVSF